METEVWLKRMIVLVLYVLCFCMAHGVAMLDTFYLRAPEFQNWTYLLSEAIWGGFIASILGWFTLLPAWCIARRLTGLGAKIWLLWFGLAACGVPVWCGWLVPYSSQPFPLVVAALAFELLGAAAVARLLPTVVRGQTDAINPPVRRQAELD